MAQRSSLGFGLGGDDRRLEDVDWHLDEDDDHLLELSVDLKAVLSLDGLFLFNSLEMLMPSDSSLN